MRGVSEQPADPFDDLAERFADLDLDTSEARTVSATEHRAPLVMSRQTQASIRPSKVPAPPFAECGCCRPSCGRPPRPARELAKVSQM